MNNLIQQTADEMLRVELKEEARRESLVVEAGTVSFISDREIPTYDKRPQGVIALQSPSGRQSVSEGETAEHVATIPFLNAALVELENRKYAFVPWGWLKPVGWSPVESVKERGEKMTPEQRQAFEEELVDFVQSKSLRIARELQRGLSSILRKHDVQLVHTVQDEVMRGLTDWARALAKGIQ